MAKRCTPWEEVRARYETEDCTYRQLAEEYGVSIQSIWTHAQKECWKGRRTRGRDQSIDDRRYLRQVAKALMTAARQAAAQVEDGEVSIKELKEMAGVLQTLTGLEKTLREEEPDAAEEEQEPHERLVYVDAQQPRPEVQPGQRVRLTLFGNYLVRLEPEGEAT